MRPHFNLEDFRHLLEPFQVEFNPEWKDYIVQATQEMWDAHRNGERSLEQLVRDCQHMLMEPALAEHHGLVWEASKFGTKDSVSWDLTDPRTGLRIEVKKQARDTIFWSFTEEKVAHLRSHRHEVDVILTSDWEHTPDGMLRVIPKTLIKPSSIWRSDGTHARRVVKSGNFPNFYYNIHYTGGSPGDDVKFIVREAEEACAQ